MKNIYKQIADRKKFVSFRNIHGAVVLNAKKITVRTDDRIVGMHRGVHIAFDKIGDDWYAS